MKFLTLLAIAVFPLYAQALVVYKPDKSSQIIEAKLYHKNVLATASPTKQTRATNDNSTI